MLNRLAASAALAALLAAPALAGMGPTPPVPKANVPGPVKVIPKPPLPPCLLVRNRLYDAFHVVVRNNGRSDYPEGALVEVQLLNADGSANALYRGFTVQLPRRLAPGAAYRTMASVPKSHAPNVVRCTAEHRSHEDEDHLSPMLIPIVA